ncbi:MAG: serine--tRNA ligase [Candidatus Micrarchaeia archaeon]
MLDIKLIRKNPEIVRADLEKRQDLEKIQWLEDLIEKDKQYRELLAEVEKLRSERNQVTRQIADAMKKGDKAKAEEYKKKASEIPEKIKQAEAKMEELQEKVRFYLMRLPNILHESVPFGKDENDNQVVRTWGRPKTKEEYGFELKSHVDLLPVIDGANIEKAAEVSGARFYYLKNDLVLLDMALQRMVMELMVKKGFTPIYPPFMLKRKPYEGVTDLGTFEEALYKIEGEDLYLISTSEHPIAAMHMNEIIEEERLPLKYVGISACFRKEAGAHGKDTKGIFRVHQFNKIEQFVFCKPEDSWNIHEELIRNAEEIFQKIEVPYRIVNICTGEIGIVAAKKYDLEAWMPAQNTYREMISCSNCTSYQAIRLNIRYGKVGAEGKEYVHTLNSTAIATPRAIVAIMENHQDRDGSIIIPKAVVPYFGKERIEPVKKI